MRKQAGVALPSIFAMTEMLTAQEARPSWLSRIAIGLVIVVLLLALAGFLYENIFEARDRRFNPMPGRRVNIGSDRSPIYLHLHCTGQGTPVVILESGIGESYISWRKVQPQIASFTRVCSHDRAGIGYSDPSSQPRTSRVVAEELHALLAKAGIPAPYILVGHSVAGLYVRAFAASYRTEVAGVVLVDASHPDQENRLPPELKNMEGSWKREAEFLEYTMPLGLPRLLGLCDADAAKRAADCNFHTARASSAELQEFPVSASEAAAGGSLGDLPLAVLSHDPDKPTGGLPADLAGPANEAWEKMQEELTRLSSRGTHTIAKNSSHAIQVDRPDVLVEAIRGVIQEANLTPVTTSVDHQNR